MRNSLSLLALASLIASLAGCSFYNPAAESRLLTTDAPRLPADAWPARQTEGLAEAAALTPDTLTVRLDRGRRTDDAYWVQQESVPVFRVLRSGVYGMGIIRELEPIEHAPLQHEPPVAWQHPEMIPRLQFVSFRPDAWPKAAPGDQGAERRRESIILRRLGVRAGRSDSVMVAMQGTKMQYLACPGENPKGLIINLSSLGGIEYERTVMNALMDRGFDVLRINPSTARVDERPIEADTDSDLSQPAERAARIIDNRVAEIAYSAEAALAFLNEQHPLRLAGKLVAVMGYSAGALAAPAVAARLHDRAAAVVLVGGGANLLDISQRSTFTNGGINIKWKDGKVTPQAIQRLNQEYLRFAHLDPYNIAPCLGDRAVLILHAMWDDIVQASDGDLLYDQLGHPERIVVTMGHQGLFWRLPAYAAWVAAWTDRAVTDFDAAGAAVAAGKSPPLNVR